MEGSLRVSQTVLKAALNGKNLRSFVASYAKRNALSPQETEVLLSAALGMSDKLIADDLGVSRHTIGTYWRRIRTKLGVSDSREALSCILHAAVLGADTP